MNCSFELKKEYFDYKGKKDKVERVYILVLLKALSSISKIENKVRLCSVEIHLACPK